MNSDWFAALAKNPTLWANAMKQAEVTATEMLRLIASARSHLGITEWKPTPADRHLLAALRIAAD